MAENDQYEDEYQFADLDSISTDPQDDAEYADSGSEGGSSGYLQENNVKRNALIAVGVVILLLILYKFFGAMFSSEKSSTENQTQQAQSKAQPTDVQNKQPNSQQQSKQPSIVQPTPQSLDNNRTATQQPQVDKKLSTIEVSQQSLRSDVNNLGNQMQSMSSTMSEMSSQVAQLNRVISSLNSKINEQNRDMERLRAQLHKKMTKKVVKKPSRPPEVFYVQALIPGRAWLNSSYGTTLTVRVGSKIPGYGIVKLIDPHQGRVLTSSGKMILFHHHDS